MKSAPDQILEVIRSQDEFQVNNLELLEKCGGNILKSFEVEIFLDSLHELEASNLIQCDLKNFGFRYQVSGANKFYIHAPINIRLTARALAA